MDLLLAFLLFIGCMAAALLLKITMIAPLFAGFLIFSALAVKQGFTVRQVLGFCANSLKDSFIVIRILLIIGCLIGLWRQCGTIAYFISLGVSVMPPRIFLLAVFLLTAAMSYAIGTSFGVTATAGVILISIARAGGVNTMLTAGAILSGVYVGDRGSPAASSANLVAVLTHTDMRQNIRKMLKTALIPFLLCCVLYGLLSLLAPVKEMNTEVLDLLSGEFRLHWLCLAPAVLMIILPFCGLNVRLSMSVSLLASLGISLFVQKAPFLSCLKCMLMGFSPKNESLRQMISGGGIISMLEVCCILTISGTYGGIFRGTGMLSGINETLKKLSGRIGRYPVMLLLSAGVCALFCNQTIGAMMQSQLSDGLYGDTPEEKDAKMMDMENSVIVVAGLIPWCIASSVPLGMLGAGASSIPFSFYLWLIPLCWGIRSLKKRSTRTAS